MSHNGKELKKSIREAKKVPARTDPFKYDTIVDPRGQWDHPGQITKIPSNNITMKGVNYPVFGIDDQGNQQMMYPGMDYTFPGQSVTEYPMAQDGYNVGSWLPSQLRKGPDPGPPKLVDKRQIPQSGMVVDKRTNQAYYFGDKGETGTFPVLTGQNPNATSNPHNLDYLSKNPKARGTPSGYYIMNTPGKAMHPDIVKEYDGRVRNIDGIPAFGVPAPNVADLAAHWTYGFHDDPKEFKRREKLYNCPPGSRWTSYGCVNMQGSSFDALAKAIPTADTMMVIDSKNSWDKALLEKAKGKVSKKQEGGWLDKYQTKGEVIHTDKATYDKAHKAEMDSLNRYNLGEKRFNAQKNVLTDGTTNGEKIIKITDSELKNYYNKMGTARGMTNLPTSMYSVTGYGDVPYNYWEAPRNLWDKYTLYASTPENLLNAYRYKKPVISNKYQEPVVEPVKEQPKKVEAPKKDYTTRNVDFNGPNPVMKYYDEAGNVIRTEPYSLKEYGGSTEFEEEDDYRSGGSTNPLMLSRSKRKKTSKNIQSSINKIFLRNYTIFGPGGKNIYDHNSKFEEGGSNWLEKYK